MNQSILLALALLSVVLGSPSVLAETRWPILAQASDAEPLPGTESLDWHGDLASRMVAGVDKFLLREIEASPNKAEYEMYEFNLGGTFNYAEMAALICPRPFMVERGHFDGVAPDEAVGYEYAKVRHLYQAQLGIGDRTEIEWFNGPHTINSTGTFAFLHKHLNWPNGQ